MNRARTTADKLLSGRNGAHALVDRIHPDKETCGCNCEQKTRSHEESARNCGQNTPGQERRALNFKKVLPFGKQKAPC
jgi:hypothetical protein